MSIVRQLGTGSPFILPARERPACEAKIEAAQLAMRRAHPGARRHLKRGLELDRCGAPAAFEIDAQPLCERHAGKRALAILLKGEG